MVADGTVTLDEGLELLDAVEPPAQPPRSEPAGRWRSRPVRAPFGAGFHPPGAPPPPPPPPPGGRGRGFPGMGAGHHSMSFEDLVELKTVGVPRAYVDQMRQLFPEGDLGELLECWEGGVAAEYARGMREFFDEIEMCELVELQSVGATVDFVARLRRQFPDLEPSAVVEAVSGGVAVEDLRFFTGDVDDYEPRDDDDDGDETPE
jgi:hypothetical protein